jgi:hypothetical protein
MPATMLRLFGLFAFLSCSSWAAAAASAAAPAPEMYGLVRVANSASCSGAASGCAQLVSVDPATGALSKIGAGHQALAALGDLVAIDERRRTYYFLGGGWNSSATYLVGLSLDTGAERCSAALPSIGEYGVVGGGQSLSLDAARDRLIITGLAAPQGPHVALSVDLGGAGGAGGSGDGCGPLTQLGSFPYSGSLPVAHASVLDDAGTTLYVDLAVDEHSYGIGVVDVAPPSAAATAATAAVATAATAAAPSLLKRVIPMDNGVQQMWGMTWLAQARRLVAVQHNTQEGTPRKYGALDWRTLDPAAAAWTNAPLGHAAFNATMNFTAQWGNLGSVRAYDSKAGVLYALLAIGRQEKVHIGAVDCATGALQAFSPQLSEGGKLLWLSDGLLQLAAMPPHTRGAAGGDARQ